MKRTTLVLVVALCGSLVIAPAIGAPRADAAPSADAGPAAGPLSERAEQMLRKRQQDMIEMHELMHRIRDAKDPKERSRLMEQHLQMLRDSWQEMRAHRRAPVRSGTRQGGAGTGDRDAEMAMPVDEP